MWVEVETETKTKLGNAALEEAYDRIIRGGYKGEYEDKLIKDFEKYLPSTPAWKKVG